MISIISLLFTLVVQSQDACVILKNNQLALSSCKDETTKIGTQIKVVSDKSEDANAKIDQGNFNGRLRNCQNSVDQLNRDQDLYSSQARKFHRESETLKQGIENKESQLNALTAFWECAITDKQNLETTIGRGLTKVLASKSALAQNDSARRNGFLNAEQSGFCFRVFKSEVSQ